MSEKCYGLLGRRLGHSWSVPIHKALGREGYRLFELEPEQLGDFLRREDVGGLNVTIPYKRDVMRFCGAIDPAAEAPQYLQEPPPPTSLSHSFPERLRDHCGTGEEMSALTRGGV